MQKKNMLLGLGAAVVAFSTLFGVVACKDDKNDGGTATDTPAAGTPSDGATDTPASDTPAADTTSTTEATP